MTSGPTRALAVTAILGAVVLAACGGSSSPPSATSAASTTTSPAATAAGGPAGGAFLARRAQLAACLKKQGVTLPSRGLGGPRLGVTGAAGAFRRLGATGSTGAAGARRIFGAGGGVGAPGVGFGAAGGRFAANPKLAAAIAKCGGFGGGFGARLGATGARGFTGATSARYRASIVSYATCMKTNGVTLPKPNFSGVGFVFGSNVNRTTSTFIAANAKCQGLIAPAAAPPPAA